VLARVHLYQAMPGTSLGVIAHHQKNVAGLGSARRSARSLLHPLTPEAAGLLLGEPRLGRPIGPRFLARRTRIGVGQRFYYLEIPGARVRVAPGRPQRPGQPTQPGRPARSSQLCAVFDFPKRELRLGVYFSEADGQRLATLLRKRTAAPAVLATINELYEPIFKRTFVEGSNGVRLIHEAAPTQEQAQPVIANLMRMAGPRLGDKLRDWLLEALKRELETAYDRLASEFDKVVAEEADGITLLLTFEGPTLLEQVRHLVAPATGAPATAVVEAMAGQPLGRYKLQLRSGFTDR
jgi:hypothetical protein